MTRAIIIAFAAGASFAAFETRAVPRSSRGVLSEPARTSASERYADLPPILLPESAAPVLPDDRAKPGQGVELVLAFVVDTFGRVEPGTVEILAAPDSAVARAVRSDLSGIRYIPARLVLDVGRCVQFNGQPGHCGGVKPYIRKLRARAVLRITASTPKECASYPCD